MDILYIKQFLITLWNKGKLSLFLEPFGLTALDLGQLFWLAGTVFLVSFAQPFLRAAVKLPEEEPKKGGKDYWFFKAKKLYLSLSFVLPLVFIMLIGSSLLDRWELPNLILEFTMILVTGWLSVRVAPFIPIGGKNKKWIVLGIWAVFALMFTDNLDNLINFLSSISFTMGESEITAWLIVKALLVFAVLFFLIGRGLTSLENYMKTSRVSPALRALVIKLTNVTAIIIAALIALDTMGLDFSALAVFGGGVWFGAWFRDARRHQ